MVINKINNFEWNSETVLALRSHIGHSQTVLSEELGVRQQTISEWETGLYKPTGASKTLLNLIARTAGFPFQKFPKIKSLLSFERFGFDIQKNPEHSNLKTITKPQSKKRFSIKKSDTIDDFEKKSKEEFKRFIQAILYLNIGKMNDTLEKEEMNRLKRLSPVTNQKEFKKKLKIIRSMYIKDNIFDWNPEQTQNRNKKLKGFLTERQKEKLKIQRLEKDLEKMRKKIEQGGSSDEGSKQEHVLIDYLKNTVFKNNREDTFYAYAKGEKGGDVLQEVVEKGKLIGKILYESKNTDSFPSSNIWITKLHQDMSAAKADIGIFFTRALPKYFNKDEDYYKDNNIFICKYDWTVLRLLASINRILLIKAKKAGGGGKGNQIGIIDFFNNTKIKNLIPIMMKSYKAVRPNLVKIQNTTQKALEDHDDSYKKLLDLFDQLAEVGVDFDF